MTKVAAAFILLALMGMVHGKENLLRRRDLNMLLELSSSNEDERSLGASFERFRDWGQGVHSGGGSYKRSKGSKSAKGESSGIKDHSSVHVCVLSVAMYGEDSSQVFLLCLFQVHPARRAPSPPSPQKAQPHPKVPIAHLTILPFDRPQNAYAPKSFLDALVVTSQVARKIVPLVAVRLDFAATKIFHLVPHAPRRSSALMDTPQVASTRVSLVVVPLHFVAKPNP